MLEREVRDGVEYASKEGTLGVVTGIELCNDSYRYRVQVNYMTSIWNRSDLTLEGSAKQITYEVRKPTYRSN